MEWNEPGIAFRVTFRKLNFTKTIFSDTSEKTSEKILELISTNPIITIKELSDNIGISKRSIERNLKKLQDENKLKRIGGDRGGHWEVIR